MWICVSFVAFPPQERLWLSFPNSISPKMQSNEEFSISNVGIHLKFTAIICCPFFFKVYVDWNIWREMNSVIWNSFNKWTCRFLSVFVRTRLLLGFYVLFDGSTAKDATLWIIPTCTCVTQQFLSALMKTCQVFKKNPIKINVKIITF